MAEVGKVIELKDDNMIEVSMTRKEACAKCRACVAGLSEKEMKIDAENNCFAKVGDWVEVQISPEGFISALFIVYGLPLVAFMIGLLPSYFILKPMLKLGNAGDVLSFFIGLACTGVVFLWIRKNEERWKQRKYRPMAVRITDKPIEEEK